MLFILVANINVNVTGLNQWRTKIRRAMAKRPTKKGILKNLQPVKYKGISTGIYEIDIERLSRQLDLISRGIYYYHFQKHWLHEIKLFITFAIPSESKQSQRYSQAVSEVTALAIRFLKDEPKRGENEEIFYYQYKLNSDSSGFVLRMVFYGGLEVVAISGENNDQSIQTT